MIKNKTKEKNKNIALKKISQPFWKDLFFTAHTQAPGGWEVCLQLWELSSFLPGELAMDVDLQLQFVLFCGEVFK